MEASEDEDYAKKIHRKKNPAFSKAKKASRVSSVSTNASDSEAFKFSRTGKQVNYNEKEVDYGLGESEEDDEPVRPKANVDFEGAEADEIEGVFGWARDETRMDDPVDLPYENIVSSAPSEMWDHRTNQFCTSAIPHQMEILLPSPQHG